MYAYSVARRARQQGEDPWGLTYAQSPLQVSSLNKYRKHYKLGEAPAGAQKEDLVPAVTRHFASMPVSDMLQIICLITYLFASAGPVFWVRSTNRCPTAEQPPDVLTQTSAVLMLVVQSYVRPLTRS